MDQINEHSDSDSDSVLLSYNSTQRTVIIMKIMRQPSARDVSSQSWVSRGAAAIHNPSDEKTHVGLQCTFHVTVDLPRVTAIPTANR